MHIIMRKTVVASDSFKGCLSSAQVLDAIGFEQTIEDADLVITGEGKIDGQTLTGKLPYAVARRASARKIPVIAICGRTEVETLPCFAKICPVTPQEMPLEQAMQPDVAMENIKEKARILK